METILFIAVILAVIVAVLKIGVSMLLDECDDGDGEDFSCFDEQFESEHSEAVEFRNKAKGTEND